MKKLLAALTVMGLLMAPGAANADDHLMDPVTVTLAEQNDSGVSGTATLTETATGVDVMLDLDGTPADGVHPAHIHTGACPDPGGVAEALTSVEDGTSSTSIAGAKLSDFTDGDHAINVHLSADEMATYVACGDIAEMAMADDDMAGDEDDETAEEEEAAQPATLPKTGAPLLPGLVLAGLAMMLAGLGFRRRR